MPNEWLGLQGALQSVLERRALAQMRLQQAALADRREREAQEEKLYRRKQGEEERAYRRSRDELADKRYEETQQRRIAAEEAEARQKANELGQQQMFAGAVQQYPNQYSKLMEAGLQTGQILPLQYLQSIKPQGPDLVEGRAIAREERAEKRALDREARQEARAQQRARQAELQHYLNKEQAELDRVLRDPYAPPKGDTRDAAIARARENYARKAAALYRKYRGTPEPAAPTDDPLGLY